MPEDFIKAVWEQQAAKFGTSHWASWGDNFAIDLELSTIGECIREGDSVLDAGCSNGYGAFHQLARKPASIVGIDFAESMIVAAKQRQQELKLEAVTDFQVGDIRNLNFPNESFDVVYTTRVLINLPNWQEQIRGIEECLRVAKKGGTVVFSEAFWEPLVLLNAMRSLKQLPPLVEHDFNRYIKQVRLTALLREKGVAFRVADFSSIYYLGSRFLRELVTDPSAYPGYSNPINEIFYKIEKQFSGGGFGIQQAYIVTP